MEHTGPAAAPRPDPAADRDATAAADVPVEVADDATTLDQLDAELGAIEDAVARSEAGDADAVASATAAGSARPTGPIAAADGPLQSGPPPREETAMGFA